MAELTGLLDLTGWPKGMRSSPARNARPGLQKVDHRHRRAATDHRPREIRGLDAQGVPGRQIARTLGVSRDSVTKYAAVQDYSPKLTVPPRRPGASVLTGFTQTIDTWLAEDARRPRKQRHTAKRVFDRLVAEHGYPGSYSPVQRHVKAFKAHRRSAGDGYGELVWAPGTAQVDFGQAQAMIAGVMQVIHVLVLTFPFSNMRFALAYPGQSAECVCHGLRTIFEHVGGAAHQLVFDNATGIGRRTGQDVIESRLFASFKLHYRSQARYCLALPGVGFDPVRYESRTADKTGNLLIESNTYCAGPAFGGRRVTVGIRHDRIEILDEPARPVVSLPRVFGHQPGTIFQAASLLPLLVRKPGAWGDSPVRDLVTDPVRDWLDHAQAAERREMLAALVQRCVSP